MALLHFLVCKSPQYTVTSRAPVHHNVRDHAKAQAANDRALMKTFKAALVKPATTPAGQAAQSERVVLSPPLVNESAPHLSQLPAPGCEEYCLSPPHGMQLALPPAAK